MRLAAFVTFALLAAGLAGAEEKGGHKSHAAAPGCADPTPNCAVTATPSFGKDGRLWLTYAAAGKVYGAVSRDNGKSFAQPFTIASLDGAALDDNGEARPKIVALDDGTLVASYTMKPEKSFEGTIYVTRSADGGKSFSAPKPLIDGKGQRFETFVVGPTGRLYVAWLDKTNAEKAKAAGEAFAGSGVAVGWSDDGGATIEGKKILLDHSCECCRVGAALDRDGLPVFAWRHVFDGNQRDHMVAKLSADSKTLAGGRVSADEWATTCPHQGPTLAIDAAGRWHVAWFTRGKQRQGLFYARSADGGKNFSEPEALGDPERAPSRPQLLAVGDRLYRAWKEFDGATTTVALQSSQDGGKSWSPVRVVAATTDASDHPLLVANKGTAYLSWLTREDGYRLIPLERGHADAAPSGATSTAGIAAAQ